MIICETDQERRIWDATYGAHMGGLSSFGGTAKHVMHIESRSADAEQVADVTVLEFRKRLTKRLTESG